MQGDRGIPQPGGPPGGPKHQGGAFSLEGTERDKHRGPKPQGDSPAYELGPAALSECTASPPPLPATEGPWCPPPPWTPLQWAKSIPPPPKPYDIVRGQVPPPTLGTSVHVNYVAVTRPATDPPPHNTQHHRNEYHITALRTITGCATRQA